MSPFWYRRICELTLLISLVILVLFALGTFLFGMQSAVNIFVPPLVAILAGFSALVGLVAYIWMPKRFLSWAAFLTYVLLGTTVALLIELTGGVYSPYIALWMILTIFAGLFGGLGLIVVFLASNLVLVYYLFWGVVAVTPQRLVVFFLAIELPLMVSFTIWHEKTTQENSKAKAFNALAKQLSQVANKSEIVINAIAEGVMAIDAKGIIQLINPAAQDIIGWTKQDAVGLDYRSVMKLSDPNNKELTTLTSPIQQVLSTNKSIVNNDIALTTISDKKLFISLVVSPVGDNDHATGAIAVFRDITVEKQQERSKAEFISTASHEMRTPVAAIEGYLGLALNPATAAIDDKARTYLLKAHESTQHLGRLFQDLLTVSRAEDGRLITRPTVVDVVDFIHNVVESLAPTAQHKGLFLYFKPSAPGQTEEGSRTISPVYYARADKDHLREIANNLVDNAIKYTKRGNITVDVQGDDNNITLSVADTGIGIPPEDVSHLFQKFYRIDNSETREIGGTGLGLYICRRLTEANNGHMWVESTYGKGSTFYLQIPRLSHERAAELIQNEAPTQSQTPAV